MKTFLSSIAALIILASCSSSKKVAGIPAETPGRTLAALPSSQINLPLKVYMRPLLTVMDSTTSKEFTNDHWPDYTQSGCDFRYKYKFIRSPFSFTCVNNKISISFRGNYQISGSKRICAFDKQVSPWVGGSCGFGSEPYRRVDVVIGSQVELLPNHAVRTTTRTESSKALDKCEVTILQTDITTQVMDSIKASIDSYCTAFDNFIQSINTNKQLQDWRNGGSRVMPISKYGYINLNPTQFRVGRFNVNKDTLLFSIGFTGIPKFSSDSSKLVNKINLPPITNTVSNSGIATYLDATYEYGFFNKLLNDSLRNKPFELEGRTFVIKEINVSGTNEGKISVDVSFTGNRKGVLHLSGTPVLDTALQVLSMPDINFSIDTKDMMVNMAKNLFRKKILKELRNQSVLDIAALLQRNRSLIEARLNKPITSWMSTSGKIHEIRLIGFVPQKNHLQVQSFIKADIVLLATPPASFVKK